MQAVRFCLIAAIGLALLTTGTLPPGHLHRSTGTERQLVHIHLEYASGHSESHDDASVTGEEDDRHSAVEIEGAISDGPRTRSPQPPAVVPASLPGLELPAVDLDVPGPEPRETPSPPPRLTVPRAPPA